MATPPLSPELAARATKELHEKAEWRRRDVEALRAALAAERNLVPCLDEHFLLRFLRARKFDYDSAKCLVARYYAVRRPRHCRMFIDFTPAAVADLLRTGFVDVRPGCDFAGAVIIVLDFGRLSAEHVGDASALAKCVLVVLEWLLHANARAQIAGVTVVIDVRRCALADVVAAARSQPLKTLVQCTLNCLPMRLKGIHVLHSHFLGNLWLHATLRGALGEGALKKVFVHGSEVTALSDYMDVDSLPRRLVDGASSGGDDEEGARLPQLVLAEQDYFEQMARYGYIGAPPPSDDASCAPAPFQCIFTHYKRVCIDALNE